MRGCDHDRVFSGQANLEQKFAWICRRCGETGWTHSYLLSQVNFDEYLQLRVLHGWATPRLPSPPRFPTNTSPPGSDWQLGAGVLFFTALAVICALSGIPWGELGSVLPLWVSLISTGIALGTATLLYVIWRGPGG